ncbi:unnamed protein product [Arctia plantaginis]|uniref:Uncharacterized protein n=1 Tax=Arctia plantaginis TaxID=874455 RepID=A0A8S0ZTG7_ARCPL|nr:unnamed protein product [Arctia plantaginis]
MNILQIMMLTLCITNAVTKSRSKKHHGSSSEEDTIENLLYFKDCQKKPKEEVTTRSPMPLRYSQPAPPPPPPPQPQCPFPKMCCALTCGNECGGNKEPSFMSRQMEPIQRQHYQPFQPIQPRGPTMPDQPTRKRKRIKFPAANMQMPINSRRGLGLTKEKIKSLINQDGDIRKILKDLVRVTMQKVDLIELQKGNGSNMGKNEPNEREVDDPPEQTADEPYDEDYVE